MRRVLIMNVVTAIVFFFTYSQITCAQSKTPTFEIGGQFSAIRADNAPGTTFPVGLGRNGERTDLGGGGRFTVNFNRFLAVESEINFFKEKVTFPFSATALKIEGVFGAKAGIRKDKFGLFGKLRPGFMHFNKDTDCPGCSVHGNFDFALDAGGVIEYYPSRRFVVRFDAGDTVIFLEEKRGVEEGFPILVQSARTIHRFQFSIGAGVRF